MHDGETLRPVSRAVVRACSTKSGSRSLQARQSGEKKPGMVSPMLSRVTGSPAVVTTEKGGAGEPAGMIRPSATESAFRSAWARSLRMTPKVSSGFSRQSTAMRSSGPCSPRSTSSTGFAGSRISALPGDPVPPEVRAAVEAPDGSLVPSGALVVRGDAARTQDSRHFGYAPRSALLGVVVTRPAARERRPLRPHLDPAH
ncbi:hypothetical protein [Streptomyces violascens]|uniref:hypothetical protein n=1 Tax=Streptomyces violascens TaxID=67381 RepID=UPI001676DFA7|nr:hypothetical protein [Streptomyces violascens]